MIYNIQGFLFDNNKIEHFNQNQIIKPTLTYKSELNCVSFCGVNQKYLCKLPYEHYHHDIINKQNVKILDQ
jgi:hypothetical protein